jgi:hypothetical protein
MLYLGIDPGAGGGIACIDNGVTFAEAMPATGPDIFALLRDQMVKPGRTVAVIEDVHTMPGQNIAAAGAFLKHAGMLTGFLIALQVPFVVVSPMKWQKALGCLTPPGKPRTLMTQAERSKAKREHKNDLKAFAQQLCPTLDITLATSDAILLATYCARQQWN